MAPQVIVLNGTSSSGKTSIARCLQALLPEPWLTMGVDSLVTAMPPALLGLEAGLVFAPDGQIMVGPAMRTLQAAWSQGVAAMARAGVGIILDVVFLDGAVGQQRWRGVLSDLRVLWVGVRCDSPVAAAREAARGDRVQGMAAAQAALVHRGVNYDLAIDTTHASSEDCAQCIVDRIAAGLPQPQAKGYIV